MIRLLMIAATAVLALAASPAAAWTRPGHVVTAAIAHDEIARRRPELLPRLGALLETHPDRGPFQVAVDRTTGAERGRRLFLECARWPDDMRGTLYDHPSWHATAWPVVDKDASAETRRRVEARKGRPTGQALEGVALNWGVLTDPSTQPAEKAVALCWLMHVVGDLHQPFHTAELFSAAHPDGDGAAWRQFVKDLVIAALAAPP